MFEQQLHVSPESSTQQHRAHLALARAERADGNAATAVDLLQRVVDAHANGLTCSGTLADAHAQLAMCTLVEGDYAQCTQQLNAALAAAGSDTQCECDIRLVHAIMLWMVNSVDEARVQAAMALRIGTNNRIYVNSLHQIAAKPESYIVDSTLIDEHTNGMLASYTRLGYVPNRVCSMHLLNMVCVLGHVHAFIRAQLLHTTNGAQSLCAGERTRLAQLRAHRLAQMCTSLIDEPQLYRALLHTVRVHKHASDERILAVLNAQPVVYTMNVEQHYQFVWVRRRPSGDGSARHHGDTG
jgi:hypothetical protein